MSNPLIPPLPLPNDDDLPDDGESSDVPATVERDGERTIDPDSDDGQVDSAAADRLASGASAEETP